MKKKTKRKEQPTTSQPTEDVQVLRLHTDQTEPPPTNKPCLWDIFGVKVDDDAEGADYHEAI